MRALAPDDLRGLIGLGRAYLQQGRAGMAERYALAALRRAPADDAALALRVRALLRAGKFPEGLEAAERAVAGREEPSVELLAAHASALFRMRRNAEAARLYGRIALLDPANAEAHLRLGSGLTSPTRVTVGPELRRAVALMREHTWDAAVAALAGVLRDEPANPVAHRLLGEALLSRGLPDSMPAQSREYRRLVQALPPPPLSDAPAAAFMPALPGLGAGRAAAAARALGLFADHLPRLVTIGGRHDLLDELERTTDAPSRSSLRGKRTFDGRVWDDVRGMGGLRAATGIEFLDEALQFGFDTLAHELAHQVHLYCFSSGLRLRIRELYAAAKREGRCLDFYAASNEAEYFGQGVEAFAAYGKRPGREATHGHTRFELYRRDPALHDLIAGEVSFDPLDDPAVRAQLLPAAIEVALRCGRYEDAATAAEMMDEGPERDRWLERTRWALALSVSW